MNFKQYKKGIELVQREDPKNGLLALAKRKYSVVNCKYLHSAIDKLAEAPQKKKVGSGNKNKSDHSPTDPYVIDLYKQKKDLHVQRSKLSNQFHECATDTDRAGISISIDRVQIDIRQVMDRIDYYFENGKPSLQPKFDELPDDGAQLQKMLLNTRSSISRAKRTLKDLLSKPDLNTKRIAKWEESLFNYERKKESIEQKLTAKGLL